MPDVESAAGASATPRMNVIVERVDCLSADEFLQLCMRVREKDTGRSESPDSSDGMWVSRCNAMLVEPLMQPPKDSANVPDSPLRVWDDSHVGVLPAKAGKRALKRPGWQPKPRKMLAYLCTAIKNMCIR